MSRIHSEWTTDFRGERLLRVYKKKGFISQEQLQHYLLYELREYGFYVSIINAGESACGGSGWPEDAPDCDDVIELYLYDHEERCPVCGRMSVPNYCVNCGHTIDLTKDYEEPIKVFRGDGQDADDQLPYTIKGEWGWMGARVEYVVSRARVLLKGRDNLPTLK